MHETYDAEILTAAISRGPHAGLHPRLGIVGGGQLARMTAMAALELGCDVVVLERNSHSPAATLASHSIVGDWNDPEALVELASHADAVTIENEFVDAALLATLTRFGYAVYPSPATVALVQDKFTQKQTIAAVGVPMPPFRTVADGAQAEAAGAELGWPLVLKARRNGYDGKGNATVRSAAEFEGAWARLGGTTGRAVYAEAFCRFAMELAVIVVRGRDGTCATYPVVQTIQRDHLCHEVRAPAPVPDSVAGAATDAARRAVEAIEGVGVFGVELFLLPDGRVWFNELAPRVHNSGHYTIEACACSQFENHVRAVLGWPLGSTSMLAPAAVMVNLIGADKIPGRVGGLDRALAVPGAHVHLYGKAMAGPGRKMGHVTALGHSIEAAHAAASRAAGQIRFGPPPTLAGG
jgi:5-(carboxyamino)imidazole ribonucleotide synthase